MLGRGVLAHGLRLFFSLFITLLCLCDFSKIKCLKKILVIFLEMGKFYSCLRGAIQIKSALEIDRLTEPFKCFFKVLSY